jgi:hypothetical protein
MVVDEFRSRNMNIRCSSLGVLYLPRRMFQKTPCPNLLLIWRNSCVMVTITPQTIQFFMIRSRSDGMLNSRRITLTIAITARKASATARTVYPYDLSLNRTFTKKTRKLPPNRAPISAAPILISIACGRVYLGTAGIAFRVKRARWS